tara:strand:- start:46 stop:336 length:291 start_codon:yes stop_codon:yes gene_type:complete
MSIDVWLGKWEGNITYNLSPMMNEVFIIPLRDMYGMTGIQISHCLHKSIQSMVFREEKLIELNPTNGWGSYDVLFNFILDFKQACDKYPDEKLSVH